MATVVQAFSDNKGGAVAGTTITVTFPVLPTAGNAVIFTIALAAPGTAPSIVSVVDNQTGNTFSLVGTIPTTGNGFVATYWVPSIATVSGGAYTVTVTLSVAGDSNGQILGLMEVAGLSGTVDQTVSTTANSNTGFTLTESAPNVGAVDLVLAVMCIGSYSGANYGLVAPPTSGYTTWFSEDAATGANTGRAYGAAYKITSAIETSSVTWVWSATNTPIYFGQAATFRTTAAPTVAIMGQICL